MSCSSTRRGQTDPLAALAAVFAVGVGLTVYAGVVADAYPGTSERAVEDVVLERTWNDVAADGVYDEANDDLSVVADLVPPGYGARVEITAVGHDGDRTTVGSFSVDPTGDAALEADDPPSDTRTASRSVAVRLEDAPPGDVRGGTLRVEVWSR